MSQSVPTAIAVGHAVGDKYTLRVAIAIFKLLIYPSPRTSRLPASAAIPEKVERNLEIYRRYIAGERTQNLADEFGISIRRVNWLIKRFRRNAGNTR